ncbi:MAG TPA: hypothetical protein VMV72_01475 [Verrucomicrobiae bacterium]|nr:hypothetical protein [Verrucomicrobiae bacterium]
MRRNGTKILLMAWVGLVLVAGSGCATCGTRAGAPRLNLADVELKRSDIVVMERVQGESTETSFLLGLVKLVDGNKVEVLGFPFFKDETARLPGARGWMPWCNLVESRAYYKALAAAPEADAIIERSVTTKRFVVPVFFACKTLTLEGKAIKLKPD